ncbi:hypothetical protein ACFWO8_32935, partial [Nocardia sp. NPDC058480]
MCSPDQLDASHRTQATTPDHTVRPKSALPHSQPHRTPRSPQPYRTPSLTTHPAARSPTALPASPHTPQPAALPHSQPHRTPRSPQPYRTPSPTAHPKSAMTALPTPHPRPLGSGGHEVAGPRPG